MSIAPNRRTEKEVYGWMDYDSTHHGYCPNCSYHLKSVLPVEPLFDLETAAALLPCALGTLANWLAKTRPGKPHHGKIDPIALYRQDRKRRVHRYLRAWEIQVIRDHMFKTRVDNRLHTMYEVMTQHLDIVFDETTGKAIKRQGDSAHAMRDAPLPPKST